MESPRLRRKISEGKKEIERAAAGVGLRGEGGAQVSGGVGGGEGFHSLAFRIG